MDLDAYRARAQAFATDLNRAHHRRFAGHDGAWDPDSLYAHHAAVFDDRAIDALREAAAREGADGHDGVRRLLRFAVEARLGRATARTDAERARVEAADGLADLTARLADEPALAQADRAGGGAPGRRRPAPDPARRRGPGARPRRGARARLGLAARAARDDPGPGPGRRSPPRPRRCCARPSRRRSAARTHRALRPPARCTAPRGPTRCSPATRSRHLRQRLASPTPSRTPASRSTPRRASASPRARSARRSTSRATSTSSSRRAAASPTWRRCSTRPATRSTSPTATRRRPSRTATSPTARTPRRSRSRSRPTRPTASPTNA